MFTIYHDIEIQSSADKIYEMITTPVGLNKWWTKKSLGIPLLNEEYQFYFSDEYDWGAKVINVSENKEIEFEMVKSDEDWNATQLSFKIIPKEHNVYILRFEHRHWKSTNEHFRRTSYCWALYFDKLKSYLEQSS